MLWGLFGRERWAARGRCYRAEHSRWLTAAMQGRRACVRIPTRRWDEGGFSPMTSRPEGRARADLWWMLALDRTDPV
ncbi:MAG: hypothetical protein D6695_10070 [Planctomycetota bacterium]|nr:MAG: hypothetical protein D6695_10070 [Planctomycetota bacterium]